MSLTGTTFNIQRFSIHDGPGIRTTVFFKGCPLHCAWCHNPEGIAAEPELVWYEPRCIGARDCLDACPVDALELSNQGMHINRQLCDACGACVQACPAVALEVIGQTWAPDELLVEVQKDTAFFETSGGGVTLSGGEPMRQADFLLAFCQLCRSAELHVALDTCGAAPWAYYERVLPLVDLVLYDLKIYDRDRHRAATGTDNDQVLENARRISRWGVPLWIRTPIIPGHTADAGNIEALSRFIASELAPVERWELLAYTNLGQPKYHRLDRPYMLEGVALVAEDEMEALQQLAARWIPTATWTGATGPERPCAGSVDRSG